MRDIKFRAWDDENEKMINVARFDFADYTVYSHLFACEGYLGGALNVMQYTGLKDVDGKEIYEGDILKIWVSGYLQGSPYVVEDMREFYFEVNRDDNYYRISSYEVIGNIHENPELLNGR